METPVPEFWEMPHSQFYIFLLYIGVATNSALVGGNFKSRLFLYRQYEGGIKLSNV